MLISRGCGWAAGAVVCILAAGIYTSTPAVGQFTGSYVPDGITQSESANLFATWAGNTATDGFIIQLPTDVTLEAVSVLKGGFRSLPLSIDILDDGRYQVMFESRLENAAELVLQVRGHSAYGSDRASVTPFTISAGRRNAMEADRLSLHVQQRPGYTDPENRVLSFSATAAHPLIIRRDAVPSLDLHRGFAVSFWMKSTGLNEVILSTWNGDELQGYPVEVIVDQIGRLRCFRGRPGEHQSMGSKRPVADGLWHRVLITNDPAAGWTRLQIDGRAVDSLYTATPIRIAMELPLGLGGRVPGENAYFDGMKPFTGYVDAVHVDRISSRGSQTTDPLHLDFDSALPEDLLRAPAQGTSIVKSDLSFRRPVDDLRATPDDGAVLLHWNARDAQTTEFVVERSRDGRDFEIVHRVRAANRAGEYEFRDVQVGEGVVFYRLRQIFSGGAERLSGTIKVGMGAEQPERVTLVGNFPNPFNNNTTVSYSVKEASRVRLSVWDLSGQPVRQLVDRMHGPGFYEVQFDAGDLPSGTYFVRLQGDGGTKSHKMILMK